VSEVHRVIWYRLIQHGIIKICSFLQALILLSLILWIPIIIKFSWYSFLIKQYLNEKETNFFIFWFIIILKVLNFSSNRDQFLNLKLYTKLNQCVIEFVLICQCLLGSQVYKGIKERDEIIPAALYFVLKCIKT
jgi:hypothetical protein